jgi:hypothetical protein
LEPLTLITEIKPLLPSNLTGEQHQRLPFSRGQLLQGVVSAKVDAHQFTLEINGHKITAESSAHLQVGQKLNLQVASLSPRIELQVVSNNPINRWLSNSIPLLNQQSLLMPEVTVLAGDSRTMAQLSPASRETFFFYSKGIEASGTQDNLPASKIAVQLLDLASKITNSLPEQTLQGTYKEISGLLQQFSRLPTLTPNTTQQAVYLAALFFQEASGQGSETLSRLATASTYASVDTGETEAFLTLLAKMVQNDPANTISFSQILPLAQKYATLPATDPLHQLLTFLTKTAAEQAPPYPQQATGRQIEDYLNRLGINMEQLLAENKPEEAARTLKFALLELSQLAGTGEKSTVAPDQLAKSLELYQLLQIRLANESLFFLPLPFSFLQQGFLLVDADHSRGQSEPEPDQAGQTDQTIELHLQLQGLGNLQVALRFLTENVEKAKFVAEFREELEQWITTGSLDSVQFLVGAKEPVKTLLKKITSGGTGIIDTRA